MLQATDVDQLLVCWDCGTPLVMHADGAEKPCGHQGTSVLTRAEYRRLKGPQMPEPDFDQIAERWCFNEDTDSVSEMDARRAEFVLVLKSIWNARGVADIESVRSEITSRDEFPLMGGIERALKTLDR